MGDRKLELLHVIFRHGERTPDDITFYRKENETNCNEYYPYGIGQLTNKGKTDMYDLGEHLRRIYNEFLGEIFLSKHVDAWSTEYERAKASLLVALAGLYPPKKELIWNDKVLWQPIPTKYVPVQDDKILLGPLSFEFRQAYNENFKKSQYGQKLLKDYEEVLSYVKKHTGLEMYDSFQVYKLYDCLLREKAFKVLPNWATDSVMSKLKEITYHEMNIMMPETLELKRLWFGPLLEKIVYDSKQKIQGTSTRKIHLYSGHEVTVLGMLTAFHVEIQQVPEEGSCVVVELYSTNKGYEVQVKYKRNTGGSFETQPFPDGQPSEPFEMFEEQFKRYKPKIAGHYAELKIRDRLYTSKITK